MTNIKFNQLDNKYIQIYGDINGFASLEEWPVKYYKFNIKFIKNNKLVKVSNNEKDHTIHNIEKLKTRILKIYNDEY